MAVRLCLEDYKLNIKTGFLLDAPLERLPDYFEPWNQLAKYMPEMVSKHELRNAVDGMQLLDHTKLSGYRQHRLAHLQLGVIASGYVWQEGTEGVTKHLPKCVSIPLWQISNILGLQPIISYADLCLANWKYLDDEGNSKAPVLSTSGDRSTFTKRHLPGGSEARWFFRVAQMVEKAFARGTDTLQIILDATVTNDKVTLTLGLDKLAGVIDKMSSALLKVHENLSAETFYFVLRPFFEGWGGDTSPLPDGLVYDGISEQPVKMGGISAAQSSILELLDALLGVSHQPERQSFLNEMRNYMLPSHKQLLLDLENMPRTVKDIVTDSEDKDLVKSYNRSLQAVATFRSHHIQIAIKYIVVVSRKHAKKSYCESLPTIRGTGGTDLVPFLKELRDDTKKKEF